MITTDRKRGNRTYSKKENRMMGGKLIREARIDEKRERRIMLGLIVICAVLVIAAWIIAG